MRESGVRIIYKTTIQLPSSSSSTTTTKITTATTTTTTTTTTTITTSEGPVHTTARSDTK